MTLAVTVSRRSSTTWPTVAAASKAGTMTQGSGTSFVLHCWRAGMHAPTIPAMKIFLDSADLAEIKRAAQLGYLDGCTTNPSLLAKACRKIDSAIPEIC